MTSRAQDLLREALTLRVDESSAPTFLALLAACDTELDGPHLCSLLHTVFHFDDL